MIENGQEVLRRGLQELPVTNEVKGFVVNGMFPSLPRGPCFEGDNLFHDVLPSTGGQRGVAVLQINLRDLQVHLRVMHGFVFGVNEALGFVGVAGAEALPPLGVGVKTIIGIADSAINQTIALHNFDGNEVRVSRVSGYWRHLPAFWKDSDILAKVVSILVSTAALSSPTHCVTTFWKWSQLSESNRRPTVYKTVALPLS